MSEMILNKPCIRALVGKGDAAGMAQHVMADEEWQGNGAVFRKARLTVERCKGLRCSLTKNVLPAGFIPGALFEPYANRPEFVAARRMRGR
jgi:hypothetical protein